MLSPAAPAAESVLTRLKEQGEVTAEDVSQIKHLLSLVDDAGVLGMQPAHLLVRGAEPHPDLGSSGLGRSQDLGISGLDRSPDLGISGLGRPQDLGDIGKEGQDVS